MMEFFYRLKYALRRMFGRAMDRLANIGGALVRPIEWIFSATVGRAFRMVERFERIDQWLLGLLWLLTWPVRIVWRLLAFVARAVLPESVLTALGGVIPAWLQFQRWLGASIWELVEWLNLDELMRWVSWLTQPIWRPLASVGGFLFAWIYTRPYRQMLWGLPGILLLLPLIGVVTWGVTWGHENVISQYRLAIQDARDAKDIKRLQLYEQKLDQLGVDTQGSDFKAAQELAEEGKLEEAYALMQSLAPVETPGFLPAHHWILVRLLGNDLDVPNDERLELAHAHLEHLYAMGVKGPEMDLLWAVWEAQSGKLEEAAARLEPLIGRMQWAALQRFEIDLKLNRKEEALRDARALRAHFEEASRGNAGEDNRDGAPKDGAPKDGAPNKEQFTSEQYMAWARAEQMLGNMDDWGRVVRDWLKFYPENKIAAECVVTLDLLEFNEIVQSPFPDASALAVRLIEIARLSEKPTELEPQVARLYHERRKSEAIDAMINRLIAMRDLPLPLMAALGTSAALEGDIEIARELLSQVVAGDAKNAVAWNNLAWAESQDPGKDPDKALVAVNQALELTPTEFRFRETRGQILVLLGRWQEAIEDLEFALNGMPDAKGIHVGLATAYEKLGQSELAQIHRQQGK